MKNGIGVAVVGCGQWGGHYVRILGETSGAFPAAICDESQQRLAAVGDRFPQVPTFGDLGGALSAEGVDAVIVATPATSHAEVAGACLAAGKHVLVEKPLTTSSADADALIELAEAGNLILMVGHTFLFNPAVLKVRELITRPGLGKIHYLYARRTNLGPIRRDVNAVWDLAAHDISIFNFMLEAVPSRVSAVGASVLDGRHQDVGFVSLSYPGGVVGHIHVSWADPSKVRELVVVAANQRIVFNDMDAQESVRVFERGVSASRTSPVTFGEFQLTLRDGDIVSPRIEPSEPLRNQTVHFLDCMRTGYPPATDGALGRDVVAVLEAIDMSMEAGGAPVSVAPVPKLAIEDPLAHSIG
jgi:predicted dehydrogenase